MRPAYRGSSWRTQAGTVAAPGHSASPTTATVPIGVRAHGRDRVGRESLPHRRYRRRFDRDAGGRRSAGAEPGVKPSASTPTIAAPSAPPPRTATPDPAT